MGANVKMGPFRRIPAQEDPEPPKLVGFPYCSSWKCNYATDYLLAYKPHAHGLRRCPECKRPLRYLKKLFVRDRRS